MAICPQYGRIVSTRDCTYHSIDIVVVVEEFVSDRWVVFYKKSRGNFEVLARYILFESWSYRGFQPLYAPIVDVGVSLDKDKNYLVVEQKSPERHMLLLDYTKPQDSQREEILMCPVSLKREECNMVESIQEKVAMSALRRLSSIRGDIQERNMVATLYSRKAFVVENSQSGRWLDEYVWSNAAWQLLTTFVSSPVETFGIVPLRAVIVDVFVREGINQDTIVVVEDNNVLRWWHNYEWNGLSWVYRTSSETLLYRVAILGANIDVERSERIW